MGGCVSRPDYYDPPAAQPAYFYPAPPAVHYALPPYPNKPAGGKRVRFGRNPPEWEFANSAAPQDNVLNTRFAIPAGARAYNPGHSQLARGQYRPRR